MKGEDFLREINNIEESIIEEAKQPGRKKRINGNVLKFIGLAACITVFTGAVIAKNIGFETSSEVFQRDNGRDYDKNIESMQETTESKIINSDNPYPDLKDGKVIVWQDYDLNGDGTADTITIDIPKDYESRLITCTVTDGASQNELYQTTMFFNYYNWKEIYLYQKEGTIYLIEYQPVWYQGVGQYNYKIFCFDNSTEAVLADEKNMDFDLIDLESYAENIVQMEDFYYEINTYLSDSMLLISTINGELNYSTKEYMLYKTENYDFLYEYDIQYIQEDIHVKLEQYFNYLIDYLDRAKKDISLTIEKGTLSASGASFEIVNAGSVDGYSKEYFRVEQLDNEYGEWVDYPYQKDKINFNETEKKIKNGGKVSFAVDWSEIYGNLPYGQYRLLKKVFFNDYLSIDIYCYFEIGEEINMPLKTDGQKGMDSAADYTS